MIKSLKNAQIADGLPRILGEQPWVKALSMAMLELHQKTMGYIAGSQIYTAIDTVAEEVLDALAVNWKIDWYDTGYDIEQKRRIVKTALNIRRTMGTAGAARTQADAIYPGTKLEEWFEYCCFARFQFFIIFTSAMNLIELLNLLIRLPNRGKTGCLCCHYIYTNSEIST